MPQPYDKHGCTDHMPRKPCTHELHWARHAVRLPAQVEPSSSTEGIMTIAAMCHDLVGSAGSSAAPPAAAERGLEGRACVPLGKGRLSSADARAWQSVRFGVPATFCMWLDRMDAESLTIDLFEVPAMASNNIVRLRCPARYVVLPTLLVCCSAFCRMLPSGAGPAPGWQVYSCREEQVGLPCRTGVRWAADILVGKNTT